MAQHADRSAPSLVPKSGPQLLGGFCLRTGQSELPLARGRLVIGRAPTCDIKIDSSLVSRQHAALTVHADRITIEDLSSRNGVFVNGVLVRRPMPLAIGDRIRIGAHELQLARRIDDSTRSITPLMSAEPDDPFGEFDDVEEPTGRADPLDLLSSIVDRALRAGNCLEAESLVAGHLSVLLSEARNQGTLKPATVIAAAQYAIKLAASTGKGAWLDYVIELHLTARMLVPLSIVSELFDASARARVTDKAMLRRYLDFVRENAARLGHEAALVLQRLERFQRL